MGECYDAGDGDSGDEIGSFHGYCLCLLISLVC